MFNHAPESYDCPFCALVAGITHKGLRTIPDDIVYRNDTVVAFVASHWWKNNPGHVLVIPREHFENLYDLPDDVGASISATARLIAIAIKRAYGCHGISTRQHNEPAGNQEVWHYHVHVFPRYEGDELYAANDQKYLTTAEQRRPYVKKLLEVLGADQIE